MKEEKTRHNYKSVVIGGVLIALILVIGTLAGGQTWAGRFVGAATEYR